MIFSSGALYSPQVPGAFGSYGFLGCDFLHTGCCHKLGHHQMTAIWPVYIGIFPLPSHSDFQELYLRLLLEGGASQHVNIYTHRIYIYLIQYICVYI